MKPLEFTKNARLLGSVAVAALLTLGGAITVIACGGDDDVHDAPVADSGSDMGTGPGLDSGGPAPDGGPLADGATPDDCFLNPTSHVEIINACTDAAKFDKTTNLPLLLSDGGLPPLP